MTNDKTLLFSAEEVVSKETRKGLQKFFRRQLQRKATGVGNQPPEDPSFPEFSSARHAFEEEEGRSFVNVYPMIGKSAHIGLYNTRVIPKFQDSPYVRPIKGRMEARSDLILKKPEQPERPEAELSLIGKCKRRAEARSRLEFGKPVMSVNPTKELEGINQQLVEAIGDELERVKKSSEARTSVESSPAPSGSTPTSQITNYTPRIEMTRSQILEDFIECCAEWMDMDVEAAGHHLACKIGTPENFSEWREYLRQYYEGILDPNSLPETPQLLHESFLPAFCPASEPQRLAVSQDYEQKWLSWDGKNLHQDSMELLRRMKLDYISVSVFSNEEEHPMWSNMDQSPIPRMMSPAAHVLYKNNIVLVVLDVREDWRFRDNPHINSVGIRCFAVVSIISPAGEAIGALFVGSRKVRKSFTMHDRHRLKNMAKKIMDDIENTRNSLELWPDYEQPGSEDGDDEAKSESSDSNEAGPYGHGRQESIIDPSLIPGALNLYKSPLMQSAGLEMADFPAQKFQQAENANYHILSHKHGYRTLANPNERSFSPSTNSISVDPSTLSQSFSKSMIIGQHDETNEFRLNDNIIHADQNESRTTVVEQTRDSTLASSTEQWISNSDMEVSTGESTSSVPRVASTEIHHEPTNSAELPRAMPSFSQSLGRLCQNLKAEMHYDLVCVAEILLNKEVQIHGAVEEDICSIIDVSFLRGVLKHDKVKQWTPAAAGIGFAMGEMMFLHSVGPVTPREDRMSGFVVVCLRRLVPKEKRPRSHEVVRFAKFKGDFKKLLHSLNPINEAFPANEATEIVLP